MLLVTGTTFASLIVGLVIVLNRQIGDPAHINAARGPQHIHDDGTPRLGGIAIGFSAFSGAIGSIVIGGDSLIWTVLMCSSPVLVFGLLEDLTGQASPVVRYSACLIAAALVLYLADAYIDRLDVALFDRWLAWPPIMVVFSLFCIAGVSQAFNIIDGKNGLSLGCSLIAFSAIGYAALATNDAAVARISCIGAGASLGLLLLNFPKGLIFLGDGGAYSLGFLVASLSVLVVARNPEISAWFPILVAAYPIFETVATFTRRVLVERTKITEPDHLHLHSLLYRNLYIIVRRNGKLPLWLLNSTTSAAVLVVCVVYAGLGYIYREQPSSLQLLTLIAVVSYLGAYALLRVYWLNRGAKLRLNREKRKIRSHQ